MEINK
jgi:hypothetical protein